MEERLPFRMPFRVENPTRWILAKIDWVAAAALLVLYAYGVFLMLSGEPRQWVDLITDDGYYYLGVVRGIVEQGSSSFSPPFETNGYQPLWVLLLSASAFVFGTSDTSLALQMVTLCYGFVAAFALASRRKFGFAFPAIATAAVFSGVTLEGMETVMMPVFIFGFFYGRSWRAKGIFSTLIFLTRLDALALVVARDAYFFLFRRERDLRHYLVLVPAAAAYFAVNYWIFGVPVPVSGLAKAVGNVPGENLGIVYLHAEAMQVPLLLLAAAAAFSALVTRRLDIRFKDEIVILAGSLAVICAYYALRSGWALWPWYYWPEMMIFFYAVMGGVLLLSENSASTSSVEPARYWAPVGAMLAVFAYALLPAKDFALTVLHHGPFAVPGASATFGEKNLELAELVRAKGFPEGTFFAMGDRAGSFGFFLGRRYRFLQTEGLVGPYSYYESMKNGQGESFLARHGVQYLVAERDRFFEDAEHIGVVEPVQPFSSRAGQYLVCFRKGDVVADQSYFRNGVYSKRYVFDFTKRAACPAPIAARFEELRNSNGKLRKFMLYSEYKPDDTWLARALGKFVPIPFAH